MPITSSMETSLLLHHSAVLCPVIARCYFQYQTSDSVNYTVTHLKRRIKLSDSHL
jgi:hypothetical protein